MGRSLQRNQRPLPLIYETPFLHNSNHDVGRARFNWVPRRWIDPGLAIHYITLHVTDSIQCRANVCPELVRWISFEPTRITVSKS